MSISTKGNVYDDDDVLSSEVSDFEKSNLKASQSSVTVGEAGASGVKSTEENLEREDGLISGALEKNQANILAKSENTEQSEKEKIAENVNQKAESSANKVKKELETASNKELENTPSKSPSVPPSNLAVPQEVDLKKRALQKIDEKKTIESSMIESGEKPMNTVASEPKDIDADKSVSSKIIPTNVESANDKTYLGGLKGSEAPKKVAEKPDDKLNASTKSKINKPIGNEQKLDSNSIVDSDIQGTKQISTSKVQDNAQSNQPSAMKKPLSKTPDKNDPDPSSRSIQPSEKSVSKNYDTSIPNQHYQQQNSPLFDDYYDNEDSRLGQRYSNNPNDNPTIMFNPYIPFQGTMPINIQNNDSYFGLPEAEYPQSVYSDLPADSRERSFDSIDDAILSVSVIIYTLIFLLKSPNFSLLRMLKGSVNALCVFTLSLSSLLLVAYNGLLAYLGTLYDFDRSSVEKVGFLAGEHMVTIWNHVFNIVTAVNASLCLYQCLRTSCLFLLNAKFENKNTRFLKRAYLKTLSTTYAFLRIPICILLDFNRKFRDENTFMFYKSLFYGIEVLLCMILLFRNKGSILLNMLILLLGVFALSRYFVHLLGVQTVGFVYAHIIRKLGLVAEMGIFIVLAHLIGRKKRDDVIVQICETPDLVECAK